MSNENFNIANTGNMIGNAIGGTGHTIAIDLTDTFDKIDSNSCVQRDLQALLKKLAVDVDKMMEDLPEEQAGQVKCAFQALISQATSKKPERAWWELSVNGLNDAAKALGGVGLSVLKNLDQLVSVLNKLSS